MISIAIDGPSGAGKSTISRILAKELGYIYVDTGALYRAIGLCALQKDFDPSNPQQVCPMLEDLSISLKYIDSKQSVILNGTDVTEKIRSPQVSMAASDVSAIPKVREFLLKLQRDIAKSNNVIMDGRDIGTVVLPNADIKIFLSASLQDRAKRRYDELVSSGVDCTFEQVMREMMERDKNDSSREVAPLKPARDAIMIDTSGNTLEQSLEIIKKIINNRLNAILAGEQEKK